MSRKSSQRRIEANRRNAQKSTGPRTVEGKARSSGNATTHGLSGLSRNPLNPGCFLRIENEAAFKGMLEDYVATYRPQHPDEFDLLCEAVYAKFRQQRVWMAETGQIEIAIARNERELQRELPQANALAHLANGFSHSENMLRLYLRYDAQLHRHYKSCLQQLQDLQASRLPHDPDPNPDPIEPKPPIDPPPAPEPPAPIEAKPNAPSVPNAPIEPKLTPEQAEIRRFEEYRDRLMAQSNARPQSSARKEPLA
jgi:hypothetical protein